MLFVDVNIEEGKTARIIVYDGDKSDDLAEKFSQDYSKFKFIKKNIFNIK